MKWIARVVIFISALFFGLFVSALFRGPSGLSDCTFTIPPELIASAATFKTPLRAQNLLGTWKGTWGHDSGDCMLQIDRVEGNAFYGTLRKKGAEIRFEGIFNPNTRMFHFEETKVVRLGVGMGE